MILLIDNYDSFTYNLWHYLLQLNEPCIVKRNDETDISEIKKLNPAAIVFSPGPGRPADAGIMNEAIKTFHTTIPLLGICLGHQAIGEFFGAQLIKLKQPMHGKTSEIYFHQSRLFNNMQSPFTAMRYHSLVLHHVEKTPLRVVARTRSNEIMAIIHPEYKITGFQFHPESILTAAGLTLLKNWWKETVNLNAP